ncbi:PpiD2 [Desulfamplus magnetovallimortis]|uniref:PpiD2 n=1 Tax=Desulfamplus magnetovallimortis TaxID=1246637 RepID=A0A1W1HIU0_9BACT|nr:SurA N-terminal domain-containing protein [Desulfamplus magnetovallimortis]SLM32399.1 PpiD2 [Desulfamplus magnetovallimortis]
MSLKTVCNFSIVCRMSFFVSLIRLCRYRLLLNAIMVSLLFVNTGISDARAELVDRIVAIVNNDVITLLELNSALRPYMDQIESAGYDSEKKEKMAYQLRQDMLNRMIERKMTDQEVKRLQLTVSDKEVDNAIERLKQAQFMTQEELEKALLHDGLTYEDYREKIREEILRPKLINFSVKSKVVVTDTDIKNYYDSHPEEFAGEKRYYLKNIVFPFDSFASQSLMDEQMEKAREVKSMLLSGKSFASLAREYSDAPNAHDGGDLGLFDLETISDTIKKAVKPLKAGEFSDIILTDQGYQIFYVERVEEKKGKSLEEVSQEISQTLYDEIVEKRFREWLDTLKEKSHIKVML